MNIMKNAFSQIFYPYQLIIRKRLIIACFQLTNKVNSKLIVSPENETVGYLGTLFKIFSCNNFQFIIYSKTLKLCWKQELWNKCRA